MHEVDIYAVTGSPAFHSLSPYIFRRAFEAVELDATYTRLAADTAAEALDTARAIGLCGINVTSPFKEEIVPLVDEIDDSASMIGAINTVVFKDGKTLGLNVDGEGVIAMCAKAGFDPDGQRVAVLGAGGAARAAAFVLKMSGADVVIVNRSEERGMRAAKSLGLPFVPLSEARDAIGNAAALFACWPKSAGDFDASLLASDQIVFDANYGESAFAGASFKAGCRYMDGIEWLLGQAFACFELLTGKPAPADAMRNALEGAEWCRGHIILTGMMGSGKSRVAEDLAGLMELDVIDTDVGIEVASGRTIPEIFEKSGEAEFRTIEAEVVRQALDGPRSVIALGGGALLNPDTSKLARGRGDIVWLWATPKTCTERASDGSRPLIASRDPEVRLTEILRERRASYARASALVVSTENRSAREAAGKIYDEIRKSGKG